MENIINENYVIKDYVDVLFLKIYLQTHIYFVKNINSVGLGKRGEIIKIVHDCFLKICSPIPL